MAVTIVLSSLRAELRLAGFGHENEIAMRLITYSTAAIEKHLGAVGYAACPDAICNEAAIRLSAYAYDQPTAGVAGRYANAMRNSGAGRILLPWRTHTAGLYDAS